MQSIKKNLYQIVFETNTKAGKRFDIILLWIILISVIVIMLESIPRLRHEQERWFFGLDWTFTIVFTLEYLFRIWISPKPQKYIFSFWGGIDFLSFLPSYLDLFLVGTHYLLIIRIFRLLRLFRVLKLVRFFKEGEIIINAMKASAYKISVFLLAVIVIVTFIGTLMYVIEGEENGFTSIPQSIYWAVVTVTTVGFGDIVPHTGIGKLLAVIAMLIGYAIIAVPTGIVTVEMGKAQNKQNTCSQCGKKNETAAKYCNQCGASLQKE